MDYQEFVSAVEDQMNIYLGEGVSASGYTAIKNNGMEKMGIMVTREGVNISPTIYLDEFYERFQRGKELDGIVKDILNLYEEVKVQNSCEYDFVKTYCEIKGRIVFKVINRKKNEELLKQIPSVDFFDLSIVFYVLLEVCERGTAILQIGNEHLEIWGITKEELYETAVENAKTLLPAELRTMQDTIEEILEERKEKCVNILASERNMAEDVMYVLSNTVKSFGAACIAYPGVLEVLGEKMGDNYYILPSSVHEVIIIAEEKSMEREEMDAMIIEINETQVGEEDVLADHAYFYNREKKSLYF